MSLQAAYSFVTNWWLAIKQYYVRHGTSRENSNIKTLQKSYFKEIMGAYSCSSFPIWYLEICCSHHPVLRFFTIISCTAAVSEIQSLHLYNNEIKGK